MHTINPWIDTRTEARLQAAHHVMREARVNDMPGELLAYGSGSAGQRKAVQGHDGYISPLRSAEFDDTSDVPCALSQILILTR